MLEKEQLIKESFTDWATMTFKSRKRYSYFKNIFFNPLTANQLTEIIFKCIFKNLKGKYNIGSKNYISKANFIIQFSKKIGILIQIIRWKIMFMMDLMLLDLIIQQ